MKKLMLLAIFCSSVVVEGCTISHYELRNPIISRTHPTGTKSCDFNYSVSMTDHLRFYTLGNQPDPNATEMLQKYAHATQDVFSQKGCK